jgi:hypothetical protein
VRTVNFTGATIDNATIGAPIYEITMQSAEGATLAVPSALNGGTGDFSVAWDATGP